MKIKELLNGIKAETRGNDQVEITGIAYNSKAVKPGNLFVAIEGFKTHGSLYLADAVARGAVACATEAVAGASANEAFAGAETAGAVHITTDAPRQFLAQVSRKFYGYPDKKLTLVGITGTNGKTTTAYLIKSILEADNRKAGLVGTIKHFDGANWITAENTTPESLDLTKLFLAMVSNRCEYCVLEVSSHALALDRVYGLDFKVAVFTNLSQDHLDFHKDLQDYGQAKQKLFSVLGTDNFAVLNYDDPFSSQITTQAKKLFYSLEKSTAITGRILELKPRQTRIVVLFPEYELELVSPLVGRHNVYNVLAAAGAAYGLDLVPPVIQKGVSTTTIVPGRMERIRDAIYVDYAHTPDALKNLISTAREFTTGRVIVVFGCGGDRDQKKRPLMGKTATELADYVIITSDNPRTEDPGKIIEAIRSGVTRSNCTAIEDRFEAIKAALAMATPDDSVLIAGKGHEDYQILGTQKRPFSDRAAVEEIVARGETRMQNQRC